MLVGGQGGKSSVLIRLPRFAKMRIFYGNVIRVTPLDNLYQTPGGARSREEHVRSVLATAQQMTIIISVC